MSRSITLLAAPFLLTAACVAIPVPHQRLPKAEGVLIDQGKPLAGVDVTYVWGRGDCADEPAETTVTDEQGHFAFAGDRSPVAMIAMLPTPPVGWHVCFAKGTYWYGEWAYTISPSQVNLQCDMRARPVCTVQRIP